MTEGLYAAYFAGFSGNALALFYLGRGIIAGVDAGGLRYDGSLIPGEDSVLEGTISVIVPAGTPLITGLTTTTQQVFSATIRLGRGFDDGVTISQLNTPAGPINARFERLRELPQHA